MLLNDPAAIPDEVSRGCYPSDVSPREKVFSEALALSEPDRLLLARELLESLTAALTAEEEAELLDRMDDIDRGGPTTNSRALIDKLRQS